MGEPNLASPLAYSLLTGCAVLIAALVLAYGCYGEYTRKAHVPGYLVPTKGLIKIFAPETGTVTEKYVSEGQEVKQGDALFVISTERSTESTLEARAAAITQLRQRRDSLLRELEKQGSIDMLEKQSLQERLRGKQAQHAQLLSELITQRAKVGSAESSLQRFRALRASRFASDLQVQEKVDLQLDAKGRLQNMQREKLQLETEIGGLQLELSSSELKQRNQRAAIERNISTVEQELTEQESRRSIVMRASASGKATAILCERGQTVTTERPLLSILPTDATLQAQLLVPSRAIGFIRQGQDVAVRYHAFPYQRFGSQRGEVVELSKTLITPREGQDLPVTLQEPAYRVTVRLRDQVVLAYGKPIPLQAGMLFEADVWLDHRRLVEWLLEPLFSISGRV